MEIIECILYDNDCMNTGKQLCNPMGIVLHSTGVNNKNLSRYVQPSKTDDNYEYLMWKIGKNKYNNSWNRSGVKKSAHYMIGLDNNGSICTVKTLPENVSAWGCGSGKYGSYNYDPTAHIQIECCEDLVDGYYFMDVYSELVELCADICKRNNFPTTSITTHKKAHDDGYASNHADIDHWFSKYNITLEQFIIDVQNKIDSFKNEKQFDIIVKDKENEYRIKGTIERI